MIVILHPFEALNILGVIHKKKTQKIKYVTPFVVVRFTSPTEGVSVEGINKPDLPAFLRAVHQQHQLQTSDNGALKQLSDDELAKKYLEMNLLGGGIFGMAPCVTLGEYKNDTGQHYIKCRPTPVLNSLESLGWTLKTMKLTSHSWDLSYCEENEEKTDESETTVYLFTK